TADDHNADPDRDGYTLLEDYLNWLAEEHRIMSLNAQTSVSLKSLFAGFTNNPVYTLEAVSGTATAELDGDNLILRTADAGLTTIDVAVSDADGTTMTRHINIAATADVETSINTPSTMVNDPQAIYNLSGQRLSHPQKGINIINSKKYIQ
ncbi:MAG: hypothetical protein J5682_03375, partial [Prevotella sp.]|nr:hypothetical protein [Prevotella sp.]